MHCMARHEAAAALDGRASSSTPYHADHKLIRILDTEIWLFVQCQKQKDFVIFLMRGQCRSRSLSRTVVPNHCAWAGLGPTYSPN